MWVLIELGFSSEFYGGDSAQIVGTAQDPTIAVWYSSTTENLQTKDYLTPGRIDFRGNNNVGYYPYPYGIKSQVVPAYQWNLKGGNTIFGTQNNTWATAGYEIVQNRPYQSLDRTYIGNYSYFINNRAVGDLEQRGYIFSAKYCYSGITTGSYSYVDCGGTKKTGTQSGVIVTYDSSQPIVGIVKVKTSSYSLIYSTTGTDKLTFMIGAPFHFYFGTVKGASALDKFKTKYSISE